MKKILIMPYFGPFPCYFNRWVRSCAMNPGINWLVITDNAPPCPIPENMQWIRKSFGELRQEFQRKLEFKIWLEKPYKLCDYKGFYGYLFSEYLEGYDFWGYCDCDVIFGDIEQFLPEELFAQFDKILKQGHLSFVRNTPQVNENFRNYSTYKTILSSPAIYGYDETIDGYQMGFGGELVDQGYRFYRNDALPADIDFRHYPFRIVTAPERCCVFGYADGKLYRYCLENERVRKDEVIYLHLQKRKMTLPAGLDPERYFIYPNVFAPWDEDMLENQSFWESVSAEQEDYFDFRREKRQLFKRDILRFLYEPKKMESISYRIRGGRGKGN